MAHRAPQHTASILIACQLAASILGCNGDVAPPDSLSAETSVELRAAFDEWVERLSEAREALEDPSLDAPPASDRGLAEGYRYLMGQTHVALERAFVQDPDFPSFRRTISLFSKATIENSDNLYLTARIDPDGQYRITGRAANHAHWRGGRRGAAPHAPYYVIFSAITHFTGDSGRLRELMPSVTANTGVLDSHELQVGADGQFEILLGPDRPSGHKGNFISTRATRTVGGKEHDFEAGYLVVREQFGDWSSEVPLDLQIARVGMEGLAPEPLTPAEVAENLREAGRLVNAQMRFWNEFYVYLLDPYQQPGVDAPRDLAVNDLVQPAWPDGVGANQATTTFGGGVYDLEPNEALIVEDRFHDDPFYTSFNLSNWWGESLDWANHTSSLNSVQAERSSDGLIRYVVAHTDPGVPNWIDTTGLSTGYMSRRFSFKDRAVTLPTVKVSKVPLAEIRKHLPPDTRRVSAEERRAQVAERQRHAQIRYRP